MRIKECLRELKINHQSMMLSNGIISLERIPSIPNWWVAIQNPITWILLIIDQQQGGIV